MAVPSASVAKVLWRASVCAGTARRPRINIFAILHSRFNFMLVGTQRAVRDVAHVELKQ